MKKITLDISGMACAACSARVEKSIKKVKGTSAVNVNLLMNTATFNLDERTDVAAVIEAVKKAGYTATEAGEEGDDGEGPSIEGHKKVSQRLLIEFAVAAVLSLPLLFGMLVHIFHWHALEFFTNGIFQLVLCTLVQFGIGWRFYVGAYRAVRGRVLNMDVLIVLGTTAAYVYSIVLMFVSPSEMLYFESSAIIITLVLLGKYFEALAKYKTTGAIKNLIGLRPKTAVRISGGTETEISSGDIAEGDILLARPGDRIAADGVIVSGRSGFDLSFVTGESMPAEKTAGDELVCGALNIDGAVTYRVTKAGKDTYINRIIRLVTDAQGSKAPIQKVADKVSGIFVPLIIGIALLTLLTVSLVTKDFSGGLVRAVTVLVIACPCALGLAAPTAVMVGSGKGAESGILFKGGEYIEKASHIDAAVFDKTGTLTAGKPEVTEFKNLSGLSDTEIMPYIAAVEKLTTHPLAAAVVDYCAAAGGEPIQLRVDGFENIAGKGVKGEVDGREILVGSLAFLSERGIDVSAVKTDTAGTLVCAAVQGKAAAAITLKDRERPETAAVILELEKMGITPYMLSGDNESAALDIAERVGLRKENVFYGVLPSGKADKVRELKEGHKCVAMVGDGINDAPAMAAADISVAIGDGTDIAVDTGNIVLNNSGVSAFAKMIRLARKTINRIRLNFFWAFVYNAVGVSLAAFGIINPIIGGAAMALSSVSVVISSLLLKYAKI